MKKNILVLGSGGARGWAHIGVIKALEEEDIPIHGVVGTSMGSLIGAAYVSGRLDNLHQVALELCWKDVVRYFVELNFPKSGLIDGDKVLEFIKEFIESSQIEELEVAYRALATDLNTGEAVLIDSGDLLAAVRASISIPGIFTPVTLNDRTLVDGGLVNPVPVSIAREMDAHRVIAVDLNHNLISSVTRESKQAEEVLEKWQIKNPTTSSSMENMITKINDRIQGGLLDGVKEKMDRWFRFQSLPSIFDVLGNSIRIVEAQLSVMQLAKYPADLLILPKMQDMNFMEFHRAEEAVHAGYSATRQALEESELSFRT